MASNEIAERFAAAAWVRCGSEGGEGAGTFNPDYLKLRSAVGFKQRIITTVNGTLRPLIVLELDRTLNRKETAIQAQRLGTVGYNDNPAVRSAYPLLQPMPESVPSVFVEPCHLDWFGPDLANPDWLPFGMLGAASTVVPDGFDMDRYNAIAVLLPAVGGDALVGDFCVAVFEHPRPDAPDQAVQADIPAEPPTPPEDPFSDVLVRWRADNYQSIEVEGGEEVNYFIQMGTGGYGNLSANGSSTGLPAEDSAFNDEPIYPSSIPMEVQLGQGSNPDAWDFLLSDSQSTYFVYTFQSTGAAIALDFADSQLEVEVDPDGVGVELTAGSIAAKTLGGLTSASENVALCFRWIGEGPSGYFIANTECGSDTVAWDTPPPEVATSILRVGTGQTIAFAELLMWNRTLTAGERTIVENYLTSRYGVVL